MPDDPNLRYNRHFVRDERYFVGFLSLSEVCTSAAVALLTELNDDVAKAILYIQCELNWPLAWKVSLLDCVNDVASDSSSALNGVAKLVLNPRQTLKQGIFRVSP